MSRLFVVRELFSFLWDHKLWWMIPMSLVFLLLGSLIILTQSSMVAPFIYALF